MISENLRRTILGVVSAILSVLMFLGVLTPENVDVAQESVVSVVNNIGGLLAAFGAIWGIFTKGGEK